MAPLEVRNRVDPRARSARARRVLLKPPSPVPLFVASAVTFAATLYMYTGHANILGWIFTFVWSLPIFSNMVGIYGMFVARRKMAGNQRVADDVRASHHDRLLVVVPTIGRHDTYPALERSVLSYVKYLPAYFPYLRIDIIAEEGAAAMEKMINLAERSPLLRLVIVPKHYQTRAGTRFKARANHYSHEMRIMEGDVEDDIWVLHMDDDTAVGPDTAIAIVKFINEQRMSPEPKHLAQGVLAYPRENRSNWFTWMADAVRPADDLARFAALTGGGTPISGLHGELLLIRSTIEAEIGWDFGPRAITEDAQLALTFCRLYPGRSDWFEGRCYGASPSSLRDFIKQRERWSWGLVGLSLNRSIPLRLRLFLGYCMFNWVLGPLQNIVFVLPVALLLHYFSLSPAAPYVLVLWSVNMGYAIWMYWEGYKVNMASSRDPRRRPLELVCLVLFLPIFSLLEGWGGIRGFYRHASGKENEFVVIAKPV
jgi:egghead protein (zeste-white 4 protein)